MHELGVVKAVIQTVESIMVQEKLETVQKIVLEIGELSGVVPAYLEACYPAAVYNTAMEHTELAIETIPGMARCIRCNELFRAYEQDFICPHCGGKDLEAVSGKELMIKQIVGY